MATRQKHFPSGRKHSDDQSKWVNHLHEYGIWVWYDLRDYEDRHRDVIEIDSGLLGVPVPGNVFLRPAIQFLVCMILR